MARKNLSDGVVVIGLGRFGKSLALELEREGIEVLGIDASDKLVQQLANRLTHVVQADSTDDKALRQLSVHEFSRAVIAIGTDLESSVLTASILLEMGISNVWAKAVSQSHARILRQLGVHHVVRPEHDMGQRVAHLVRGRMLDYIEFDDGYALIKTQPPAAVLGKPLGETRVRSYYNVTVVGVKRAGQSFTYATPETVLEEGDIVIVSGERDAVENFSDET
ncbi:MULTISPECIES: TrkA family potassium uptake protein [Dermacoccus]|uniref:TrkA family potassium uptake protein n=2 Tax=Dermacoccus TaxID=57495 RepID=A0A417Z1N5_9MICO|nr:MULTISPECIES: TrkA family potassium uptake protein [Dermacoccus]MBZ4498309.1 TrkA family potassium uptake protein [Dermacoccus sp. Tok2021]RHW44077.1 TrkA family potassium uptake protein [Dermacoccus abyssi]